MISGEILRNGKGVRYNSNMYFYLFLMASVFVTLFFSRASVLGVERVAFFPYIESSSPKSKKTYLNVFVASWDTVN